MRNSSGEDARGSSNSDITYTVITAPANSADQNYDGENAVDFSVTNLDDDEPLFSIFLPSIHKNMCWIVKPRLPGCWALLSPITCSHSWQKHPGCPCSFNSAGTLIMS
jgi:hypothetical protein